MPPQPHVNTGQKMWQLVVLGTGFLFVLTGVVIWFLRDIVPAGVFQWFIIVHDVAFIFGFLMLLVHIYLGAIHPRMVESFRSMLDGKISPTYARHHYGKWYDDVSQSEDTRVYFPDLLFLSPTCTRLQIDTTRASDSAESSISVFCRKQTCI